MYNVTIINNEDDIENVYAILIIFVIWKSDNKCVYRPLKYSIIIK